MSEQRLRDTILELARKRGPTSSIWISSGNVCEMPVTVTVRLLITPVSPETTIGDGYGVAVVLSLIVMADELHVVAAGASD